MAEPSANDLMEIGEMFNTSVKSISDVLLGAVNTLVAEGWTDAEARQIVLLHFQQVVNA